MPLHGNHYMLKQHAELSRQIGTSVDNVIVPDNGSIIELYNNGNSIRVRKVAAAYTIQDEKKYKFQIIAYQKAADAVERANTELSTLYKKQGNLQNIDGIGKTISERLVELFETGHVEHYDTLLSDISPAVFPLLDIPSFGPKKAYKLVSHFKLHDPKKVIKEIYQLAQNNRIAELDGFGEKSQTDILRAIDEYNNGTTKTGRMVLPLAFGHAQAVISFMKQNKNIIDIQPLGSLRRMVSTVGDIDIAVTTNESENVIKHFISFPGQERVIERGPTTASLLIGGGKHVDLLVLPPNQYGSLLQHFTGSKNHNVALREYALKKGFSLSERGIKLQNRENELIEFKTEEKFYKYLGMDWIPPEIRENQGEIEKAINHDLPNLVKLSDIQGDLHIHSNYPIESSHDYGNVSMEVMLERAIKLRYTYFAFSEHNPSVMNHSKNEIYEILKRRKDKIDKLKLTYKNSIRIVNLLEVDILASGDLALDDKAFEYLDAAIVSIHSSFKTPIDKMTERVIKGLEHPKAKILAHPTGRLLNTRTGYELHWSELFSYAAKNNKALEINAWPERLDLTDSLVKEAKDQNVKFIINTDSHALSHMDNMFYGVSVARRGWCTKKDVINSWNFENFAQWLRS
jgi:DNA polymerase (family 10)